MNVQPNFLREKPMKRLWILLVSLLGLSIHTEYDFKNNRSKRRFWKAIREYKKSLDPMFRFSDEYLELQDCKVGSKWLCLKCKNTLSIHEDAHLPICEYCIFQEKIYYLTCAYLKRQTALSRIRANKPR